MRAAETVSSSLQQFLTKTPVPEVLGARWAGRGGRPGASLMKTNSAIFSQPQFPPWVQHQGCPEVSATSLWPTACLKPLQDGLCRGEVLRACYWAS